MGYPRFFVVPWWSMFGDLMDSLRASHCDAPRSAAGGTPSAGDVQRRCTAGGFLIPCETWKLWMSRNGAYPANSKKTKQNNVEGLGVWLSNQIMNWWRGEKDLQRRTYTTQHDWNHLMMMMMMMMPMPQTRHMYIGLKSEDSKWNHFWSSNHREPKFFTTSSVWGFQYFQIPKPCSFRSSFSCTMKVTSAWRSSPDLRISPPQNPTRMKISPADPKTMCSWDSKGKGRERWEGL